MSGPRLLAGAGLGLLLFTAALGTPADADLWGHLTFGRDIISTGHVIQADRYAFTSDRPWINHEWLTEVSLASVYRLAGPAGLVALKLAIIAALLFVIWRHVTRLHPPALMTLAILTLAFAGTFWRTHTVRPQLFSVLFFAILLVAMVRAGEGRWRSLLIVPPLMALWVNLHGGWIVGLGVLALWTLVQIVLRRQTPATRIRLSVIGLAAAAATLLNPHGLQMWTFLGETVRFGRDDIEEWGSILTHPVALGLPWLITLVAAGAAFWRSPQVRRLDHAAIVLLLAALSFRVSRLDAFFALAVVILLAPGLVTLFSSAPSVPSAPLPSALPPLPLSRGVIVITILAIAAMLMPAAPLIRHYATCLPIGGPWTPEPDAARFIARNHLQGRMLTWFDWGEYAIWHFGPDLRVSMDGRRETVYTAATVQAHRRFYAGDGTALAYLRDLNPDYIWLPTRLPIVGRLAGEGWVAVFSGPVSAVFARTGAGPFLDAGPPSSAVRCFPGP
jgi:hypothetical protein